VIVSNTCGDIVYSIFPYSDGVQNIRAQASLKPRKLEQQNGSEATNFRVR